MRNSQLAILFKARESWIRQGRVYTHHVKQYLFARSVILFKHRQDGNSSYGQCTRTRTQKCISGLFPPVFRTLHSFAEFCPQQLFFASLVVLFFISHSPRKQQFFLALLWFPGLGMRQSTHTSPLTARLPLGAEPGAHSRALWGPGSGDAPLPSGRE